MAGKREVFELPFRHASPIPTAIRMGNMFFSSGIGPEDPDGKRSADIHEQVQQVFSNLKTLLDAAGFTLDDLAQVTVYMARPEHSGHREILNKYWREVFPDEQDRPVRKTLKGDWENDQLVQFQVIAVR